MYDQFSNVIITNKLLYYLTSYFTRFKYLYRFRDVFYRSNHTPQRLNLFSDNNIKHQRYHWTRMGSIRNLALKLSKSKVFSNRYFFSKVLVVLTRSLALWCLLFRFLFKIFSPLIGALNLRDTTPVELALS